MELKAISPKVRMDEPFRVLDCVGTVQSLVQDPSGHSSEVNSPILQARAQS
jgi:hypothetical protein